MCVKFRTVRTITRDSKCMCEESNTYCVCLRRLSLNILKLWKTPKSLARSHTLFVLPPSHQNHLSEQNRGSLRVVSLFGATNKSSRALHQMNSPLDWRLHKGLLTCCVRACFSGNGFWLNTSIQSSAGEEISLIELIGGVNRQTFFTGPFVKIARGSTSIGDSFILAQVGILPHWAASLYVCDLKRSKSSIHQLWLNAVNNKLG